MKSTQICPSIVYNWPEMSPSRPFHQLSEGHWEDNYGNGYGHSRNYWQARRAFLSSYHFQEKNGIKEKLKKRVKEINEVAIGVALNVRREISERRLGIRVFRFTFALPSFVLVSIRCFTPWVSKRELMCSE
ncbi:hypothetical protein JCGZ_20868 [Jatropha curcas]|uniref:Uncharacterized protein n=1 Tax=Jatropha curcas TaxID=180498 RepID=A0A067L9F4_JATCU|nr:hypothetical protein JCGZ_20868 [Jatropha curcas]